MCRYFLCRMKALTTDIKPCSREISEAVWMPIDEFLSPSIYVLNRVGLCLALGRPLPKDYTGSEFWSIADARSHSMTPDQRATSFAEVEMMSIVNPTKSFKIYHTIPSSGSSK